jgi:DNA polymerase
MTAGEKAGIASFLDTALSYMGSGYRAVRKTADWEDDAPPEGGVPPEGDVPPETRPGDRSQEAPETVEAATSEAAAAAAPEGGLSGIASEIASCRLCGLCTGRKNTVPGEGAPRPTVLVVGEGPGADEDVSGRPFVGAAGQLLDKMLESIDLSRQTNTFITNIVKCRPPGNRDPHPDEREACLPYLVRQINILKPQAILVVGRVAAQTMLAVDTPLSSLRGTSRWEFRGKNTEKGYPLFVTYHPSALLRNPQWKRPAWEDLKAFKAWLKGVK